LVASCLALAAHAQTAWPSKPVKLVVAFPPGGVADVMARVVSQPLSEALGQPVIIENRAGANGNVAADAVAKAPADGYTLLVATTGIESANPFLFGKMPFDPGKDLAHVAALGRIQLFLVTRPSLPVKDTKEFVAFAKANPGKLSYGSAGAGSTAHRTWPASCSSSRRASTPRTFPTAARRRRCRTCWPARSTTTSTRAFHFRTCARAS